MRLLLDTHTLLWLAHDEKKLPKRVIAAIEKAEEIWVSAISAMEIATKSRLNRLEYETSLATRFVEETTGQGFLQLPLTSEHAQRGGNLPAPHTDPWDRLLIAQAQVEQLTLVSNEKPFDRYGIFRLW